ncbi:3-oxoacyl-[acyl-carrier protein] reductase/pteridine reductase [Granulicella pectinivorans]|uniref:3-oxoacyl-[acyl-carrier protein] reductase/pteridine reductase n=1 Tax=Granulicella pectinivorans TaxID=474950 RepID=A0A1I6MGU4_9BACT|nr:3-oxoacyl-[acyl-carrier protein] reductase/pteridine reductase [Granulicella pectinivorans]
MQEPRLTRLLEGRTALVTGAARRIGRAIALAYAEQGAAVAITYRGSKDDAAQTVRDLEAHGVKAAAIFCDLTAEASVTAAVAESVAHLGGLDLLVNNAGLFASAPLEDITAADWDGMFAANTRGPFLMAKAALPHLRATRGRILNIGSLGGTHPWPTHGHYCTSKAALHMLSQTMAKAWAPEVSVNCIAPGMIVQGEVGPAYEHFAHKTPMQRNGTSADIAAAALFFATGPHFITGQMLGVDGGLGL